MKLRLYTPVYAFTLLISAALLFSVQPMFSKMVLPLLGGTPQVWNTAMLFFQATLLAGYAYAHGTSRFLNIRAQSILHLVLLCLFLSVLPFAIPEGTIPPFEDDPTFWQLGLMAVIVGGPFFVLSGSAPMFQRWFAGTDHPDADNPYFLYGASNLGSMTSLLAYPFFIEPYLTLDNQSWLWMCGYTGLIAFTLIAALLVWTSKERAQDKPLKKQPEEQGSVSWHLRGKWLLLSFLPSSLMLGVTTYITTDIASVPLLWILPLALYVGTFILVFSRRQIIKKDWVFYIQGVLLALLITKTLVYFGVNPFAFIGLHFALFFFCALACHQELADSKPSTSHLTEFYLLMSLGGALGGVFNALIAPRLFLVPLEYAFVLIVIAFLRYWHVPAQSFSLFAQKIKRGPTLDNILTPPVLVTGLILAVSIVSMDLIKYTNAFAAGFVLLCLLSVIHTRWALGICLAATLLMHPPGYQWQNSFLKELKHLDRNFFGVVRVIDTQNEERVLLHGTTNHGAQPLLADYRLEPLSYYGRTSPLRDAFDLLNERGGQQRVAIIGLGIGVTACFQKDGRHFDFYEIDPDIARIAQNEDLFTYLSDCGSPYDIILGDGRLTVQDKPEDYYDMILLDAFSSDNIPVHLLTIDALKIYLSKLKPNGILIFNVSNNFMDIEPVLAATANELGLKHAAKISDGVEIEGTKLNTYTAHFFMFLPDNENDIDFFTRRDWSEGMLREGVRYWSDQYSNIVSVLGNHVARKRYMQTKEEKQEFVE